MSVFAPPRLGKPIGRPQCFSEDYCSRARIPLFAEDYELYAKDLLPFSKDLSVHKGSP